MSKVVFISHSNQDDIARNIELYKTIAEYNETKDKLKAVSFLVKDLRQSLYSTPNCNEINRPLNKCADFSICVDTCESNYFYRKINSSDAIDECSVVSSYNPWETTDIVVHPNQGEKSHNYSELCVSNDCCYQEKGYSREKLSPCNSYVSDARFFNEEELTNHEYCHLYYLYAEVSKEEKRLKKEKKKLNQKRLLLTSVKHSQVTAYNLVSRVFRGMQSIRINDKSGDEINNLGQYELLRLLICQN